MAKKALVLFANGFEEIEAATPVDVLRRADVEVTTAGVGGTQITGARNIVVLTDTTLENAAAQEFDCIVFPGGMPGAKNLGESALARDIATKMLATGKLVSAICAAPVHTLGAWGLLDGRRATCYPGLEKGFPAGVIFSPERVVVDGKITTSRGPGTALEFSLSLAAQLAGDDVAKKVGQDMLVK